jgi:hypothetical protein
MERSNQPPKPECCSEKGGEEEDLHYYRTERSRRSVHREKREPQLGPASRLSDTASKRIDASGDGVEIPEPNTEGTATGEVTKELPGSKSVARDEDDTRNWGDPENSRRTNCEGQAGRESQRQGGTPDGTQGVGSAHSSSRQTGATWSEVSEGADTSTKPAQALSTVSLTETCWRTFLQAITVKTSRIRVSCHLWWRMRERGEVKSPVRENRTPGSVRGAPGNRCPYLDNPK